MIRCHVITGLAIKGIIRDDDGSDKTLRRQAQDMQVHSARRIRFHYMQRVTTEQCFGCPVPVPPPQYGCVSAVGRRVSAGVRLGGHGAGVRLQGQPVALGTLVPDPGLHPAALAHRLRVLGGLRRQVSAYCRPLPLSGQPRLTRQGRDVRYSEQQSDTRSNLPAQWKAFKGPAQILLK